MRFRIHFAALALILAGLPTAASAAQIHHFKGTRDQVRAACTGPDRELIESGDSSFCMDNKKHTGVECKDDGTCVGSTPRTSAGDGPSNRLTDGRRGAALR